jgi:rod shape-determining protein MreD
MMAVNPILILLTAFLAVFLQSSTGFVQRFLGTQIDLLPALMVYASLTAGPFTIAALALCGGLWFDSLSENPTGLSVLPLLVIGYVISRRRDLILRSQTFAQAVLGVAASALVPLASLLMLLSAGRSPIFGWGTLWQWLVMAGVGGLATPGFFKFFGLLAQIFAYQDQVAPGFRPDREIRRGRT